MIVRPATHDWRNGWWQRSRLLRIQLVSTAAGLLLAGSVLAAGTVVHAAPGIDLPNARLGAQWRDHLGARLTDFAVRGERSAAVGDRTTGRDRNGDRADIDLRTRSILAGGVLAVGAYGGATWWREGLSGEFQTVREGWFGQNTGDGGADKLGHLHANYVGTRLLARAFEWAGNDPDRALSIAAWSTLGTFVGVEVLDAFTPRYRFSPEDTIMNAVGVGIGVLMERHPRLDALLDLRLQYRPSNDPRLRNGFDPFGDYSGQTYLLVAKATGVPALAQHRLLRYFELAVGYGTRGYESGPDAPGDRSRNLYVGLSLNLSEVLGQTVFSGRYRDSTAHRVTRGFNEVFQLPGTTALAARRL